MSDERSQAAWLATLPKATAMALDEFIRSEKQVHQVRRGDLDALVGAAGCHDGAFWANWAMCEEIEPGADVYPRFQFNFSRAAGAAPRTTPTAAQPATARLKLLLSSAPNAWEHLKSISGPKKGAIACHYVSYAAGGQGLPVSTVADAGWDMSHLCDNGRCVRHAHLRVESHSDNMARQRCNGVTLIVTHGVIVAELPCKHADEDEDGYELLSSCTRLSVLDLSDVKFLTPAEALSLLQSKRPAPAESEQPQSKFIRHSS